MQKKSNFLTKFVKKDYNNKLEEVLSQKNFSEEVKNTLLSMFYKIENGYKDYKNVKRETFEKKEYIEKLINIVDKDCKKITFLPINSNEKEVVDSENQEIKCLPIENRILYSLAKIQKRNIVVKYVDESIAKAFSFMLNTGNNINIVEPLRDFNGFSWNVIINDIEDLNYNLLYQNIIFLMGNKFVDKWVNNYEPLVDYFELFESEIEKKYGSKTKEKIMEYLIRISLKLKMDCDIDFENEVITKERELKNKVIKLNNKEQYLVEISKEKKQKEQEIKKIDKIINDKNLLNEEYKKRNSKLPLEKKIFSIRVLKKNLKEERDNILIEINKCNEIINPKHFIEIKSLMEQRLRYFENIENLDIKSDIIKLQKEVIKCMYIELQNIKDKTELITFIYKYRYYNLLPVEDKKEICKINDLKSSLNKLTKYMIDKSTEMKVINQLTENEEYNYNIIQKLLLLKIIELENINLKLNEENEKVYIIVYDEEIEETKIELKNITKEELKIKNKKKTKLFI